MNKKGILSGCAALMVVVVAAWNFNISFKPDGKMTDSMLADVEALANGEEGGANLTCYCALMSDQNCAVNNNGSSVCAGGENIKCWEYNRNCN